MYSNMIDTSDHRLNILIIIWLNFLFRIGVDTFFKVLDWMSVMSQLVYHLISNRYLSVPLDVSKSSKLSIIFFFFDVNSFFRLNKAIITDVIKILKFKYFNNYISWRLRFCKTNYISFFFFFFGFALYFKS